MQSSGGIPAGHYGTNPTATVPPYQPSPVARTVSGGGSAAKINVLLRLLQVIFSLVSFSVMASAHGAGDLKYTISKAFEYNLSVMVILFVYALAQAGLSIWGILAGSMLGGRTVNTITAVIDMLLSYLAFGAANAAAAIIDGFVCDYISSFCGHVKAAVALSFFAWLAITASQFVSVTLVIESA